MKNIKIDENAARLLLVEGRVHEVFSVKLLEHMGISDDILVVNYGGKHNLKNYLLAILNSVNYSRNRQHIGIVRDADYDTDAFASAISALEHANRHQGAAFPDAHDAAADVKMTIAVLRWAYAEAHKRARA